MSMTYLALLLTLTGRLEQTFEGGIAGSSKIRSALYFPLGHTAHTEEEKLPARNRSAIQPNSSDMDYTSIMYNVCISTSSQVAYLVVKSYLFAFTALPSKSSLLIDQGCGTVFNLELSHVKLLWFIKNYTNTTYLNFSFFLACGVSFHFETSTCLKSSSTTVQYVDKIVVIFVYCLNY